MRSSGLEHRGDGNSFDKTYAEAVAGTTSNIFRKLKNQLMPTNDRFATVEALSKESRA
jgi:hypothetical protein